MRLSVRDAMATLFVAAAVALYALWETGTAAHGMSARGIGAVVFALGFAACTSDATRVAGIYVPQDRAPSALAYGVVATVAGVVALVAGLIALVAADTAALAVLVTTMAALWALATLRHATSSRGRINQEDAWQALHRVA